MKMIKQYIKATILEAIDDIDAKARAVFQKFVVKFPGELPDEINFLREHNPHIPFFETKEGFSDNHADELHYITYVKTFVNKVQDDDVFVLIDYISYGTTRYKVVNIDKLDRLIKIAKTFDEFQVLIERCAGGEINVAHDKYGEEEFYGYVLADSEDDPDF